jgi:phage shock protein A
MGTVDGKGGWKMEQAPDDLTGMEGVAAKEYIAAHLTSLKLTERKIAELDTELEKWRSRLELARSKAAAELATAAEAELLRLQTEKTRLSTEADELKSMIERMRHQLPGLAARVRTIDPDLLEQELLMATGRMPGDEALVQTERKLASMEKQVRSDDALQALKVRMGLAPAAPPPAQTPPPDQVPAAPTTEQAEVPDPDAPDTPEATEQGQTGTN